MAEAIRDGTGTIGADAKVGSDNRLWVRTEGITLGSISFGSVSIQTGSEVFMPGGSVVVEGVVNVLGSTHVTQSTNPWIILGSVAIDPPLSVTTGSEVFMPGGSVVVEGDVSVIGSTHVTQSTDPWIVLGSVQATIDSPASIGSFDTQTIDGTVNVNNIATAGSLAIQEVIGSVRQLTDPWIILGSVHNVNSPSVTVGSESVIVAGSVLTYDPIGVGSVLVTNGSIQTFGASVSTGSESFIFGKSGVDYYPLLSTSGADGGILRTTADVSVTTGSEAVITAGSVQTYSQIGSVEVWQQTGTDLLVNGSMRQLTDPWIILGSVHNVNSPSVTVGSEAVIVAGSVQTYSQIGSVEVWQDTGTALLTNGSMHQFTDPWIILGSVHNVNSPSVTVGSESVIVAGSVQPYSQIGSVEIWQTTAADLVVDIGDIGSVRAILDDPVSVGSYTSQNVVVTSQTDFLGLGSLTLQHAAINVSSGPSVQIVAGVNGLKTYVYAFKHVSNLASTLKFQSQGDDLEGPQEYADNGGATNSVTPPGYLFRTGTGSDLQMDSTAGSTGGFVSYWQK